MTHSIYDDHAYRGAPAEKSALRSAREIEQLQRDLAQARAEAAKYRAALEHVIEHLELRDDGEYIEQLARAALEPAQ